MSNIKNITTTNARLRKALRQATTESFNNNSSNEFKDNLGVNDCTLCEAAVVKWFVGLNRVIIRLVHNNNEVESIINYPFINEDLIVSVVPDGELVTDDEGSYIVPSVDTHVNVLEYRDSNNRGFKYCIIGFNRNIATKSAGSGEILLQAGNNQIVISKEFININTNALFINGVKYDKTEVINLKKQIKELSK